ncbi:aspartic protease [Phaffia rhodozyma]|uniref:Aspartic protease n=2 Tax=Phaffia rhodozyma TaxID=264483 RepID=ASPR1_PHARH|nr:RecName: Full=Aspartic protease; Flags: Precursor [Phaffia rhodozyma]AAC17105.1 aspartic protease precursor [Phaffia rhodozyma]CED82068.1 aspartic protease [Phaffia rhodozyma]
MISDTVIAILAVALVGSTVQAAPVDATATSTSGIIAVPISKSAAQLAREADPVVSLDWLKKTKAQAQYKHKQANARLHSKRATGASVLTDQGSESLWTGPITIGGQSFTVDWDTGSSDLWVPSSACSSAACNAHHKYTLTSTGKKQSGTFSISYGDGSSASGPVYKDNVVASGLQATSQVFGAVTSESSSFSSDPSDGISGLGWPALAQLSGTSYFWSLINQGTVTSPVFSFRLATTNSELYLGGINSAHYTGAITYTPVTQKAYWTIALGGVSVNGAAINPSVSSAIIDTGTTLVYGPTAGVAALYAKIPGSASMADTYGSDYQGYYTFPCSAVPTVALTFGGSSFSVPTSAFNLGTVSSGSKQCVGGIVGQGDGSWLVGDVFLQGVYSIYDVGNARVGFAKTV